MNRLKAVSMLVALSSIAIVMALTSQATQATRLPPPSSQTAFHDSSLLTSTSSFTCTVNVTTTDMLPDNQTPQTAASLASYYGLALVPSPTLPGTQAPALDDWFVLGNTSPNFQYTFEAVPDYAGNYNLGMEIYSSAWSSPPVAVDTDPLDGNSTRITLRFASTGPYYIRIFQISPYCSGGTYHLTWSYILPPPPTPTATPPTFDYGYVVAGPSNLWPQWSGFNYELVFDPPQFSQTNELMRVKVDASDLNDVSAFQGRMYHLAHDNPSIESFQIGNEPNLSSEWNAPPDASGYRTLLCAAYTIIKYQQPSAKIISGGLAPTGRVSGTWSGHAGHDGLKQDEREFLEEFLAAGGGNCLDAVGYNALGFRANYDAAPDVDGGSPETNCANGLCFRSVEKAYAIMQSHGLNKPVWATEVGWLVAPPSSCVGDSRWSGRTWQIVTPAQQADNLVGAFRYARLHWPWMSAMFVFNLDFNLAPWYDECEQMRYYSVVGQPAFRALQAMSKEVYRLNVPVISK